MKVSTEFLQKTVPDTDIKNIKANYYCGKISEGMLKVQLWKKAQ